MNDESGFKMAATDILIFVFNTMWQYGYLQ